VHTLAIDREKKKHSHSGNAATTSPREKAQLGFRGAVNVEGQSIRQKKNGATRMESLCIRTRITT